MIICFHYRCRVPLLLLLLLLLSPVQAAWLNNVPQTVTQPDGTTLKCLASGDEYHNWLHDAQGYTITQHPKTGWYVYARAFGGVLLPTAMVAGRANPRWGLPPKVNISLVRYQALRGTRGLGAKVGANFTKGAINNLVVFIRFSDQAEYTDPISTYTALFNGNQSTNNSLYNYYRQVSYNTLSISSTFYPAPVNSVVASYKDSQPRRYYMPYNATTNPTGYKDATALRVREHTLLRKAALAIAGQVPTSLNLDKDSDGKVDGVSFIVQGAPGAWGSILWSHQWNLSLYATINGKRVYSYVLVPQGSLLDNAYGNGTLCHEWFHQLGAPDLYHYNASFTIDAIGPWDIMNTISNPPPHMCAYMKWRYGKWLSGSRDDLTGKLAPPDIGACFNGITYPETIANLRPLSDMTGYRCWKIPSPYSRTEYFLVEYRKKAGTFEISLLGSGLLIYRIDTTRDGMGNGNANWGIPPDEVYLFRENGYITIDNVGSPQNGNLNNAALRLGGRRNFGLPTAKECFLGDQRPGGVAIKEVGYPGAVIPFKLAFYNIRGPDNDHRILGDSAEMVYVPAGRFLRGTPAETVFFHETKEEPQEYIQLSRFWIYKYEVRTDQFQRYCLVNAYDYPWDAMRPSWGWIANHPMERVSWLECSAYAQWAHGSLPTEAQWEKAARGVDGRLWPWGNVWDLEKCNNLDDHNPAGGGVGAPQSTPVGSYPAGISPYGALDMAGNASEWVNDWYQGDYYSVCPKIDPPGPATGTLRVDRGMHYTEYGTDDYGYNFRVAFRCTNFQQYRYMTIGFRCVVNPPAPE